PTFPSAPSPTVHGPGVPGRRAAAAPGGVHRPSPAAPTRSGGNRDGRPGAIVPALGLLALAVPAALIPVLARCGPPPAAAGAAALRRPAWAVIPLYKECRPPSGPVEHARASPGRRVLPKSRAARPGGRARMPSPMPKHLLIVESPAKARTINKYLGKDFQVLASYGHVRDLVPKEGAVDPDDGFRMRYELIDKNEKHVDAIAKAAKAADSIWLATDPDREGEAISWHIAEILRERGLLDGKQLRRVVFTEITARA